MIILLFLLCLCGAGWADNSLSVQTNSDMEYKLGLRLSHVQANYYYSKLQERKKYYLNIYRLHIGDLNPGGWLSRDFSSESSYDFTSVSYLSTPGANASTNRQGLAYEGQYLQYLNIYNVKSNEALRAGMLSCGSLVKLHFFGYSYYRELSVDDDWYNPDRSDSQDIFRYGCIMDLGSIVPIQIRNSYSDKGHLDKYGFSIKIKPHRTYRIIANYDIWNDFVIKSAEYCQTGFSLNHSLNSQNIEIKHSYLYRNYSGSTSYYDNQRQQYGIRLSWKTLSLYLNTTHDIKRFKYYIQKEDIYNFTYYSGATFDNRLFHIGLRKCQNISSSYYLLNLKLTYKKGSCQLEYKGGEDYQIYKSILAWDSSHIKASTSFQYDVINSTNRFSLGASWKF
ncbi:hypothetical protein [Spirochaeta cellobiosiphila]|uniref:hypothetical protein n=1 Tax=Spirochaeta cellobiosiphila TaxID=504483 RepID=UPI00049020C4|nr:hypothetical protein [Spirochaeta cellobiosiphila]